MQEENIKRCCYELYKLDWLKEHVTEEMKKETVIECFKNMDEADVDDSVLNDWVEEQGYGGELYACYGEFLGAEFLDRGYMEYLLNGTGLWKDYRQLIKEEEKI